MIDPLLQGGRAKQLLEDPVLAEAFERTRLNLIGKIEASNFNETKQREDSYYMLRALASVKGQLEADIRTAEGIKGKNKETERQTVRRIVEHKLKE